MSRGFSPAWDTTYGEPFKNTQPKPQRKDYRAEDPLADSFLGLKWAESYDNWRDRQDLVNKANTDRTRVILDRARAK